MRKLRLLCYYLAGACCLSGCDKQAIKADTVTCETKTVSVPTYIARPVPDSLKAPVLDSVQRPEFDAKGTVCMSPESASAVVDLANECKARDEAWREWAK